MSKVVFVGNVPYNMSEDQLSEVFRSVGEVVGFRLVYDRETGKPRGYGFCEFADAETAASAVRNLHNFEVGGRNLRIDLAESDPFLEGKTTVRGELVDGQRGGRDGKPTRDANDPASILSSVPQGLHVPPGTSSLDMITHTLATMPPGQLFDVLAQMKAFVITHPEQARTLFTEHPQIAYAVFQSLLLTKIVDPAILQRMLADTAPSYPSASSGPPPMMSNPSNVGPSHYPPPPSMMQQVPPRPHGSTPLSSMPRPPPNVPMAPSYATHQGYPPPPPQQPPSASPAIPNEEQQRMIQQVLNMSQAEIDHLPPQARDSVMQLRAQLMGSVNMNM